MLGGTCARACAPVATLAAAAPRRCTGVAEVVAVMMTGVGASTTTDGGPVPSYPEMIAGVAPVATRTAAVVVAGVGRSHLHLALDAVAGAAARL